METKSKCTYRVEFGNKKDTKVVECKNVQDAKKRWETDKKDPNAKQAFVCTDTTCFSLKK